MTGRVRRLRLALRSSWPAVVGVLLVCSTLLPSLAAGSRRDPVDVELTGRLQSLGFTGRIESTLSERLGRSLDPRLADTGRLLWFDTILGLNDDNACAGCHSPAAGFGDTQSIAIGIDSNRVVGPDRIGPRNQRRAPMVINNAFYPSLMLNDRFASLSGDPFDPSQGFPYLFLEVHLALLLPAGEFGLSGCLVLQQFREARLHDRHR